MATTSKEHDKTAVRLTQILIKLNDGEKLEARKLAEEFNVTLRTIQRDFSEHFIRRMNN
jgi:predicted DNA-binding transcriptional regulator YafY